MFKRFFVFFCILFFSLFIFILNVNANDELFIKDNSIAEDLEKETENSVVDDLDYFFANCEESVELPETYDFTYDEEKGKTRDAVYGQVYGYIRWTDDLNNTHALEDVTVVIRPDNGSDIMTRTNSAGFFSIAYYVSHPEIGSTVEITIYSSCTYVRVLQENGINAYSKQDTIYMSNYYSYVYNYTFTNSIDGNVSRGMQILSAMQNYYNYASSLLSENDNPIPLCKAVYPYYSKDENNQIIMHYTISFYNSNNDTIYLSNDIGVDSSPYSYSSWDVIGHEYGHHIQHYYFSHSIGGGHIINKTGYYNLLYYDESNDSNINYPLPLSDQDRAIVKRNGCELAFNEGWPTFFALTAQKTFSADIKTVPTVNNTMYDAYNFTQGYELNRLFPIGLNSGGESTEKIVCSLLYNLWDTDNSESWDNLSISDYELFYLMKNTSTNPNENNQPENLSEFLHKLMFISDLDVSINDIGKMLSAFRISPYGLSIYSYANSSQGQGFIWSRGNVNLKYPEDSSNYYPFNNNSFRLEFYDENDNLLLNKNITNNNPYAIADEYIYVLSTYEWNMVLQCLTPRYYVVIVGSSSNYCATGPFYSERYYFDLPSTYNINLTNFNYYEKQFNILPGQIWMFNLNFSNSGYKLIQTFGTGDTVMSLYDDYHNLISEYDDEGYEYNSLLYYNFSSSMTYHLYVWLYNEGNSGIEKLSIIPTTGDLGNGITSIDELDDINSYPNQDNYLYQTTVPQYESTVLLFYMSTPGYYRIYLNSQFDNMLCCIDPTSSNLLVDELDYCDDYCIDSDQDLYDDNAQLGVYDANGGKLYFLVIGKSNPSDASGTITIRIQKLM